MHGENPFKPDVERDAIRRRRGLWLDRQPGADALPPENPVGLAFSGGGIRSAIFSLGLAQAIAKRRIFPQVDYLSTVSGGGYTGSFLGALFLPRQSDFTVPDPRPMPVMQAAEESARDAAERAERILTDDPHRPTAQVHVGNQTQNVAAFHPLQWLRENGRYLTPSGARDLLYMAAFYLRSLLGVHYVLGLLLLGAALGAYVVRLGLHLGGQAIGGATAARLDGLDWDIGVAAADWTWWSSPILWLVPAVVLLVGGPLVLAYWLVFRQESRDRLTAEERAIKLGPWWLLVAAAVSGVLIGRFDHWSNPVVYLLGYAVFLAVVVLLMQQFWIPRWLEPGEDWSHTAAVARVRLKMTQALTTVLQVLIWVAAIGLVDSFGQTLFVGFLRSRPGELLAIGSGGGAIAVALALARKLGAKVLADETLWKRLLARLQKLVALVVAVLALAAIAALLVAFVQWIAWSPSLPEWRVKAQAVLRPGHWALLLGLIVTWVLLAEMVRETLGFLNNSTFHRFYCARLVRTFLGAANFKRLIHFQQSMEDPLHAEAGTRAFFVSESHPHDEVALRSYYAGTSAAPLHLVCTTLNESLSETSTLVREDRKGVTLAVGPCGLNVGNHFYRWAEAVADIGLRLHFDDLPPLPDSASATERDERERLRGCERLSLGQWAAISGAAVSTGVGHHSSLGFSILAWLVNARLAYWWLPAPKMSTQKRASGFKTFDLVRQELTGGFYGQRGLYWNLSDGGHFENTGVYELLRRRATLIVCSDNGADPEYRFGDLQNLVRRARIDLGAEIEFFGGRDLERFVGFLGPARAAVKDLFGAMEQFRDPKTRGDCCALAARVRYAKRPDGTYDDLAREALLVVVKPALTGFAPLDVKLYGASQPAFPQQSTGDQFFDEAQWESYRRLGQEIGLRLFEVWGGFVGVARQMAAGTYDAPTDPF
jgi:hypothetical protein